MKDKADKKLRIQAELAGLAGDDKQRTQNELGRRAGYKSNWAITGLLHYGRGASPEFADRLAALTGTDIRVWLNGGDIAARRKAVKAWQAGKDLTNNQPK